MGYDLRHPHTPYSFLNKNSFIEIGQRITAWEIVVQVPLFVYKRISLSAKHPVLGATTVAARQRLFANLFL